MKIQINGLFAGEYNIDTSNLLGQGGFGKIFKCHKINDPAEFYCAKLISNVVNQKTLQSEKKAVENMKELHCENLVKMYDMIEQSDQLIIIMELCDSDLQKEFTQLQVSNTWYSQEEQYNIIKQILKGSEALVKNQIIHRDIKPENILIKKIKEGDTERKIYKISDFGFSRKLQDFYEKQNLTRAGTRTHCAPEIQDGISFNAKCDIYSYGILFHQIVNQGKFPFQVYQIDRIQFTYQLKTQPFKFRNPLQGEIGLILMNLIEKMIVFDIDKRVDYDEMFRIFVQGYDAKSIFLIQEFFYNKYMLCKTIHDELIKISSNEIEILMSKYLINQIGLRTIEFAFALCHQILIDLHQIFKQQEFSELLKNLNEYKEKIFQEDKYMEQKNKISEAFHQQFQLCQQNFDQILQKFDNQVNKSFQGTLYERAQTQKVSIQIFCRQLNERIQQDSNLTWFQNLEQQIKDNIQEICKFDMLNNEIQNLIQK